MHRTWSRREGLAVAVRDLCVVWSRCTVVCVDRIWVDGRSAEPSRGAAAGRGVSFHSLCSRIAVTHKTSFVLTTTHYCYLR